MRVFTLTIELGSVMLIRRILSIICPGLDREVPGSRAAFDEMVANLAAQRSEHAQVHGARWARLLLGNATTQPRLGMFMGVDFIGSGGGYISLSVTPKQPRWYVSFFFKDEQNPALPGSADLGAPVLQAYIEAQGPDAEVRCWLGTDKKAPETVLTAADALARLQAA